MTTVAAQAQSGRKRARESRIAAARERRLMLDPVTVEREIRIDEATVDIELAWESRGEACKSVKRAEFAAAEAVRRLLSLKVPVSDVAQLTGLDQSTVRRLRQLESRAATTGLPVSSATSTSV